MKTWLLWLLLMGLLCIGSVNAGDPQPEGRRREYRQHQRRAERARRHRVQHSPLPTPNPKWRQKNN